MARPLRIEYPGAVYHVTCRGNEQREIFTDDADRRKFIELLEDSAEMYSVKVYAYVLMSNHFHLLIETPLGNLGEFMRRYNISYTGYFNRRHKRVGHLYQGRYKGILVERDSYLEIVSRYIHLNPVRTAEWKGRALKEQSGYLAGYKWSSLPDYISGRSKKRFTDCTAVLGAYGGDIGAARKLYWADIMSDLSRPLIIKEEIVAQTILGGEKFVKRIKEDFFRNATDRECSQLRELTSYKAGEEIFSAIEKETGKCFEEIKAERGCIRQVAMYLLQRKGGLKGREIGELLGVDYSTVSVGQKRLRERLLKDGTIRQLVKRIEGRMSY